MITIRDLDHLGPALGILRRRADLMQKEISTLAGMSRSQVSRYERGRDIPNLTTLIKYLEVAKADFQLLHRAIVQVKQDSGDQAPGLTPSIDPLEAASIAFLEPVIDRMLDERVGRLEERFLERLREELPEEQHRSRSDTDRAVDLNELLTRLERVEAVLRLGPGTEEEEPVPEVQALPPRVDTLG